MCEKGSMAVHCARSTQRMTHDKNDMQQKRRTRNTAKTPSAKKGEPTRRELYSFSESFLGFLAATS